MAKTEMRSLTIEVTDLTGLTSVAIEVLDFAEDYMVWTLDGGMGAGKTAFVKVIGEVVGIVDMVNSPTFSIVNEYRDDSDKTYYHFDFYRIKDEQEARDIGAEEYFYSGDYCFIEWPSLIPSLLPDKYLNIEIQIIDQDRRIINCTKHG